jgi:hypothetical protein
MYALIVAIKVLVFKLIVIDASGSADRWLYGNGE